MVTIKTPRFAFVRFDETGVVAHPLYGNVAFYLPVYEDRDWAFQFVLEADTEAEADTLSAPGNTSVLLGIVNTSNAFLQSYGSDQPQRFRISPKQILYNWVAGFPGFASVVGYDKCFKVSVTLGSQKFYSNIFQRISSDNFTSVIDYSNDDNSFGFNYCASGVEDPDVVDSCQPTEISFINTAGFTIPYTAQMREAYGLTPTVQVWIQDTNGELVNAGIQAILDQYPPTLLTFDFGGEASGLIVIK